MRRAWVVAIGFCILIGCAAILYQGNPDVQHSSTQVAPPQSDSETFCRPAGISALMQFEPAAGNVYGTMSIQNTSQTPCEIIGNGYINPMYFAHNVNVANQAPPGPVKILLAAGQKILAKVHHPNGPQCSEGIQTVDVTFKYQISPSDTITFKGTDGKEIYQMNSCKSPGEQTEIQVWGLGSLSE